jgi:predicted RNA binding protein YcfA (HicA-like mRNA interferase family)
MILSPISVFLSYLVFREVRRMEEEGWRKVKGKGTHKVAKSLAKRSTCLPSGAGF